jgi:aminoglycoside phosphotransferase (APT) family kinase protein
VPGTTTASLLWGGYCDGCMTPPRPSERHRGPYGNHGSCATRDRPPSIGHGEPAPWNIVARDLLPVAFVDWEFAGPVDRLDEVAHAAWLNCQLHDDDIAVMHELPSVEGRARQLRSFLDGYGLGASERIGFVERMIHFVVRACAHEAIDAQVTPNSTDLAPLWALAWRARSAAWMIRHESILHAALFGAQE